MLLGVQMQLEDAVVIVPKVWVGSYFLLILGFITVMYLVLFTYL